MVSNVNKERNEIALYYQHTRNKWLMLILLIVAIFIIMLVSLNLGSSDMSLSDVFYAFIGQGDPKATLIIWQIRMVRVIAALLTGTGLSLAGCVMQNNLRNPLADPYILGISSAATFGANVAIIILGAGSVTGISTGGSVAIRNPYTVTTCAFLCAMSAMLIILTLAKLRGFTPEAIVLAGVALSSIFYAGTMIVQYFATDITLSAAVFWTFGDLGRVSWNEVIILNVVVMITTTYFFFMRWDYNALANGEETAKSLGVKTEHVRFFGLLAATLVTAVSVSFMGMIGFIGLIGPQAMKRIVGEDHRFLIPASALAGSAILLTSDALARIVISPVVLPVGAITSLLGGPMFLFILLKGVRHS
jgi:iron complex transport system permease protein